jgi:anti-sigma B factor antagonist
MTAAHAVQAATEISVTALRPAGSTIAGLHGVLDVTAAPALRESLFGMLSPGVRELTVDLSEVTSCDVAVLAVLIGTQRRARARGITMRLADPGRQVAELLRVTGLDRSLTVSAAMADGLSPQRQGLRVATVLRAAEAA